MSTPTTIERVASRLPLKGLAVALLAWFCGMAVLACVVDPPAVVAFGPETATLRAVARGDALLVSAGTGFLSVRSDSPGYVRRLYANGAWFVWPVFRAGCGA